MSEMWKWGAGETAQRIKSGDVGCVEVVESHLARLDAVEPHINGLTLRLAEEALDQARQCDRIGTAKGDVPPLFGVPVTIKSNVDQKGLPTTNGVPDFAEIIAAQDAPLVANLLRDGAVIIGRTATPEFSLRWFTTSPLHGVTRNPWDDRLTPGGSSGGAAALLAAGVGCIAHGNDLGGSLRYPAYCCGLATIRPSLGRVPAHNASGAERPATTMMMSVQGPIARNVGDVRLGLRSMARRSAQDPVWVPGPDSGRERTRPLRIGWQVDPFGDGVEAPVRRAVETARDALLAAGHELVEVDLPRALEGADWWGRLLMAETDILSAQTIAEHGSPELRGVLDGYRAFAGETSFEDFVHGQAARTGIRRAWNEMFEDVDLVLMPVSGAMPLENDFDFRHPDRLPELMRAQRFLYLINLLGLPAAAVPTGLENGCPMGVQIVGPRLDDELCLDAAQDVENQLGTVVETLWDRL